ncbi:MAG: DsrE family protein [Anaerolineae bacterium]|nr:DsrE family protein [Anaerolineae bacterium]MDW8098744.1 DsrE family protein [Anaerolineae bacterium]
MPDDKDIVIVFKSDGLGITEAQELKEKLAGIFLRLLSDSQKLPRAICFYTDGVKLVCRGSPVLEELRALEQQGVRLIVCQTCLNYFGLTDQVQVGIVGGMADIITAMWNADSVITV